MSKANKFGKEGWVPDLMDSQKGKTFVITGTTSGTGFEASRILLRNGAKVVMLNRNPQKAEGIINSLKMELGQQIDVQNVTIDLSEQDSIKKGAEKILNSVDRIDALICNGAIAQVPSQKITVGDF